MRLSCVDPCHPPAVLYSITVGSRSKYKSCMRGENIRQVCGYCCLSGSVLRDPPLMRLAKRTEAAAGVSVEPLMIREFRPLDIIHTAGLI
jgi:hypothetical protein